MLDHSAVHEAAGVPGLGDAPVAVLVVLRPPEQLGPGHAHLLDDVARDHEPAPRPPLPHRPVGLHGPGEAERRLGVVAGLAQQGLEALGVGHDVVVEHPGEVVGPGQQLLEGERPSSGGAEVGVRPHHRDRACAVPRSSARTGGSLALSTTITDPGRTVWASMASRQRARAWGALWDRTSATVPGPRSDASGVARRGLGLDVRGEFAPRRRPPAHRPPGTGFVRPPRAGIDGRCRAGPGPRRARLGPWPRARLRCGRAGAGAGRIEEVPREPARPPVASRQGEIVAGQVVRPPRLVGVVGPMVEQRVVAAGQGLAVRHLTGTDHVHQDQEPGGAARGSRSRSPRNRRRARSRAGPRPRPRRATPGSPPTSTRPRGRARRAGRAGARH